MQTQTYKTKTIFNKRTNPGGSAKLTEIGLDLGYSGVKVMSPIGLFAFPSYAARVPYGTADSAVGSVDKNFIAYRSGGSEYFVGQAAMDNASNTDASASGLADRDRYLNPGFKILAEVGIALGMGDTKKPLFVSTGLPPAYLGDEDKELLIDTIAGVHNYSLKLAGEPWREYQYEISPEHVHVMAQPMGTLFSCGSDANGGPMPNAKAFLSSSVIVFDPGFGTLDTFAVKSGFVRNSNTRDDLGMKAVLEETARLIEAKEHVKKSVHDITAALGCGYIIVTDKKRHKSTKVDFAAELEQASKMICNRALDYLDATYNYLDGVDYLVITGGTGAAWEKDIRARYKDMDTLNVVSGNMSDTSVLPIFANVRGYYMAKLSTVKGIK